MLRMNTRPNMDNCLSLNPKNTKQLNNSFYSAMASGSGQCWYDAYDLSIDNDEYLVYKEMA